MSAFHGDGSPTYHYLKRKAEQVSSEVSTKELVSQAFGQERIEKARSSGDLRESKLT
jgi:hypothetical protein